MFYVQAALLEGGKPAGRASALVRTRVEPKTFFANERTFLSWCVPQTLLQCVRVCNALDRLLCVYNRRSLGTAAQDAFLPLIDCLSDAIHIPVPSMPELCS